VKYRQQKAEASGSRAQSGWRLPAAEVEDAVIRVLAGLLEDRDWLLQYLRVPSSSIADQQALLSRGQELAQQLKGHELITKRGLVLALVDRIVLGPEFVELKLKPAILVGRIADTRHEDVDVSSPEMITVRRAVSLRRRSIETRMIIEGQGGLDPEPDLALIKALAQAHRWWGDLVHQCYATMRELAQAYDTDERYVARVISLAFMPANLTEAILEGTQPPELTLHGFLRSGTWMRRQISSNSPKISTALTM
jgi:hypothetical protein